MTALPSPDATSGQVVWLRLAADEFPEAVYGGTELACDAYIGGWLDAYRQFAGVPYEINDEVAIWTEAPGDDAMASR